MKIKVTDRCIGCGACVSLTDSEVFDFNDEGLASVKTEDIPKSLESITKEAINSCPVNAIEEIEE